MNVTLRAVFNTVEEADAALLTLRRNGIDIASAKLFPNRRQLTEAGLLDDVYHFSPPVPPQASPGGEGGRHNRSAGSRPAAYGGGALLQVSIPESDAAVAKACVAGCRGYGISC